MTLGIPTHIAVGALGISADLDPDIGPDGMFQYDSGADLTDLTAAAGADDERGSRIVLQDSDAGQRVDTPGFEGSITGGHFHGRCDRTLTSPMAAHKRDQLPVARRDWKVRAVGGAVITLDIAKGVAEAFGPLKAVLGTISAVYNQYKVRPLRL
jgi:hypothetical protein